MTVDAELWDAETSSFRNDPGGTWRDFCDELHRDLLKHWLPNPGPTVLKTDLFDEAAGTGFLDVFEAECKVVGIDISPGVATDAAVRSPGLTSVVGDLRRLPFRSESFDTIVSNSSLDHFPSTTDIVGTLKGLHHVLKRDGILIVTLDNPRCPAVLLRSILPYRLLRRLGILKYPVGATMSLRRLRRELVELGFVVERQGAIMHVPRVLVIPVCARIDGWKKVDRKRWVRRMMRAEILGRLPTRQLSGHFVAVLARKAT